MDSILQKNLKSLRSKDPDLYNLVISFKDYKPPGKSIPFINHPNISNILFEANNKLAYLPDNPYSHAINNLKTIPEDSRGVAVFVGNCLGYNPIYVLEKRPKLSKILIIEPYIDMFIFALHNADLTPLFETIKTSFYVGIPDFNKLENDVSRLASIFDVFILKFYPLFDLKTELYENVHKKVFELLNFIVSNGSTISKCGQYFFDNSLETLKLINSIKPIENFRDVYKEKPAICVSAGPSLDLDLEKLKKIQDRAVIISVDSAVLALLKYGIEPDFVTSIDYQMENFEKFIPFLTSNNKFRLVTLNKINPMVLKRFNCRTKTNIYLKEPSYEWINYAINSFPDFVGAFSCANLSLQLAYHIGANPIILIGQDLGYPLDKYDHSEHVVFNREISNVNGFVYYQGLDNTLVKTDNSLLSIKTFFEKIISEKKNFRVINATSKGVVIEGTERIKLDELGDVLNNILIKDEFNNSNNNLCVYDVNKIIVKIEDILNKINLTIKKIDYADKLCYEIISQLKNITKKNKIKILNENDIPSNILKQIIKFDEITNYIDEEPDITKSISDITYKNIAEYEAKKYDNEEILKKEGYFNWLVAELKRINEINQLKKKKIIYFRDKLIETKNFIFSEIKLLKRIKETISIKDIEELCWLYLINGYSSLASHFINKLEELNISSTSLNYLKLAYSLLIFNYDACKILIEKVNKRDEQFNIILKIAQNEISLIEKMMIGKFSEGFPNVFKKWSERTNSLLTIFKELNLSDEIKNMWDKHRNFITDLLAKPNIDEKDKKNILNIINQWEPLSEHLLNYNDLTIEVFYRLGEKSNALIFLEKLLNKKPDDLNYLTLKTKILFESNLLVEAINFLQYAIIKNPKVAILWEDIGDILFSQGNFSEAIIAYENCIKALPEKFHLLIKIGDAYNNLGFADAAQIAYQEVLKRYPDNQMALLRIKCHDTKL